MLANVANGAKAGKVYWLSVVTFILVFFVNTMGFVDTRTNSSEGMGRSWPFSSDGVLPAHWQQAAVIEFTHRAIVFVFMVALVSLAVLAWRRYGAWIEVKILISVAVLFVFLEAALGAVAVLFVNPPAVVATHMGIALVSFGALFLLSQLIRQIDLAGGPSRVIPLRSALPDKTFNAWAWFTLVYVLFAVYFGGYVASTGAGGRFQGWPLPTETYQHAGTAFLIDVGHRSIALGLVILLGILTVKSYRMRAKAPRVFHSSVTGFILVFCQAVSGALLIYTELSMTAFLIHVSVATFMFGSVCSVCIRSLPEVDRAVRTKRAKDVNTRRPLHA